MTEIELNQMRDALEQTLHWVREGLARSVAPYADPPGPTPADLALALKRMRRAIFDKLEPSS